MRGDAFLAREINLGAELLRQSHKFKVSAVLQLRTILSNRLGAIIFATSLAQITDSHKLENGVAFHVEFIIHLLVFDGRIRSCAFCFKPFVFSVNSLLESR